MVKTVEQRNREINQIRRDQRNADEALLLEVADSLPNEHLVSALHVLLGFFEVETAADNARRRQEVRDARLSL